jgi:hypothetical protein
MRHPAWEAAMTEIVMGDDPTRRVDESPCESDRQFFGQHPRRRFRLRPAWDIEIQHFARHGGGGPQVPAGHCWWMLVRLVKPHVRMRFAFTAKHDLPPETSERDARRIWRRVVTPEWTALLQQIGTTS